jgi:hypothetical protein
MYASWKDFEADRSEFMDRLVEGTHRDQMYDMV